MNFGRIGINRSFHTCLMTNYAIGGGFLHRITSSPRYHDGLLFTLGKGYRTEDSKVYVKDIGNCEIPTWLSRRTITTFSSLLNKEDHSVKLSEVQELTRVLDGRLQQLSTHETFIQGKIEGWNNANQGLSSRLSSKQSSDVIPHESDARYFSTVTAEKSSESQTINTAYGNYNVEAESSGQRLEVTLGYSHQVKESNQSDPVTSNQYQGNEKKKESTLVGDGNNVKGFTSKEVQSRAEERLIKQQKTPSTSKPDVGTVKNVSKTDCNKAKVSKSKKVTKDEKSSRSKDSRTSEVKSNLEQKKTETISKEAKVKGNKSQQTKKKGTKGEVKSSDKKLKTSSKTNEQTKKKSKSIVKPLEITKEQNVKVGHRTKFGDKSPRGSKAPISETTGKSYGKKLVLMVPEIPPSKITNDVSKMLVYLRRIYLHRPKSVKLQHKQSAISKSVTRKVETKLSKESSLSSVPKPQQTDSSTQVSDVLSGDLSHDFKTVSTKEHVSSSSSISLSSPVSHIKESHQKEELKVTSKRNKLSENISSEALTPKDDIIASPSKKRSKKSENRPGRKKKPPHDNPDHYIIPFLDTCAFKDKMDYAQTVFDVLTYRDAFQDIRVYNIMLEGWAQKARIDAVKKIFIVMAESGVKPDISSYGAALECLGRMKSFEKHLAKGYIEDLEEAGYTLDDLVLNYKFKKDGREVVLEVIQAVLPDFKHPPAPVREQCDLVVVEGLYDANNKGMNSVKPLSDIFSEDKFKEKLNLQWKTEEDECICIKSIEEETNPSQQVVEKRKILSEHKAMWKRALSKALQLQKQKHNVKTFSQTRQIKEHVYPFMALLRDEDYVQLMLESLPKFAATSEGIGTLHLARELGSRVFQRYIIRKKRKSGVAEKTRNLYWKYMKSLLSSDQLDKRNHREQWSHLLDQNQQGPSLNFDNHIWPSNIILKVGNYLADILLREIQINSSGTGTKGKKKYIPGLYHMYSYRSMKQVGFIKPHPLLIELFQGAKDPDLPFDSNILPMVTPPLPWTSAQFGGYPLSATKLMRCKEGSLQYQLILEKAGTPELNPVLDSLNQLSAVPWKVNKKMLNLIVDVFKTGGNKELDIPLPSSAYATPPPITSEATPEEIAQIHQERAAMRKAQAEMHSLRTDMLYKLSIAHHFQDEVFWFPHNMDFRGRVYPCPPHFNHLGSDVTRSLLHFAQGKPLGEKGLDWLKIHLINLTGHKKRCSLADRLAYANEIMADVLDSADKPFEGKKWWQTADEPWQTLACCMEIADASRSPDPTKFVSHLPIHQDGSCNGLQHYAALGRDVIGAQQVNLYPFDIPQDVYSGVAQMVEELRQKDAESDVKIAQTLEGLVQRKVVKQTVMTVVYGVTTYGGRHQIYRQLKDMEVMSEDDAWYAAGYLVLKVFQSLGKMFAKTREIQDWLTESALMIAKGGSSVEWVTPLGLPIVQPYHKKSQIWISTTEKWSLYHNDSTNPKGRPDAQKQKNAFPPNFIHSLDSTHMMLTSLYCQKSGVTFASVHDCFWTHACTVDTMNKICREQFVKLHEQPILHDLAKFLEEKYGDIPVSPNMRMKEGNPFDIMYVKDYVQKVPETGEFDLKNVLDSTFFFS